MRINSGYDPEFVLCLLALSRGPKAPATRPKPCVGGNPCPLVFSPCTGQLRASFRGQASRACSDVRGGGWGVGEGGGGARV